MRQINSRDAMPKAELSFIDEERSVLQQRVQRLVFDVVAEGYVQSIVYHDGHLQSPQLRKSREQGLAQAQRQKYWLKQLFDQVEYGFQVTYYEVMLFVQQALFTKDTREGEARLQQLQEKAPTLRSINPNYIPSLREDLDHVHADILVIPGKKPAGINRFQMDDFRIQSNPASSAYALIETANLKGRIVKYGEDGAFTMQPTRPEYRGEALLILVPVADDLFQSHDRVEEIQAYLNTHLYHVKATYRGGSVAFRNVGDDNKFEVVDISGQVINDPGKINRHISVLERRFR